MKTFTCDCGFQWAEGKHGGHDCSIGYKKKIEELKKLHDEYKEALNSVVDYYIDNSRGRSYQDIAVHSVSVAEQALKGE